MRWVLSEGAWAIRSRVFTASASTFVPDVVEEEAHRSALPTDHPEEPGLDAI
jgi:hypothetical protein